MQIGKKWPKHNILDKKEASSHGPDKDKQMDGFCVFFCKLPRNDRTVFKS